MSIKDTIMADIKSAMKAKESEKLSVLRMVHSEIKNKEINMRPDVPTEDDFQAVLKKMSKQRKDSITQFTDAGRIDLADKETAELAIVSSYLPEELSREKVEAFVEESIKELSADSMKFMGQVMKSVMAKSAGAADNKMVSEIVKTKLS